MPDGLPSITPIDGGRVVRDGDHTDIQISGEAIVREMDRRTLIEVESLGLIPCARCGVDFECTVSRYQTRYGGRLCDGCWEEATR